MRRLPLAPVEELALPTGWYAVLLSHELPPGSVRPLRCFERDLVAYRGEDGAARVLDARCPHLGAHLGHGGRVVGNDLKCPFHGWCFDGEGACVDVPYAKRIPPNAALGSWPVKETLGAVMVWYDDAGAPPAWEPPHLDELSSPQWVAQERRCFTVRTPVQELAENAVDRAHFHHLHGMAELPTLLAESERHLLRVRAQIRYPVHMGAGEGQLATTNWGLGISAVRFTGMVETFLLVLSTPAERGLSTVRIAPFVRAFGDADMVAMVGRMFVQEVVTQFEADIPIWENKVTLRRPVLCEGDGPIALFRRWTRQFYAGETVALTAPEDQGCAAG